MGLNSAIAAQGEASLSSNELALDRTRMAQERTMMAWIRTSSSMISFGFSIYKFFDYFQKPVTRGAIGPREFALFLIGTGLFVLAAAAVQSWEEFRRLRKAGHIPRSLATTVAIVVFVLGVLAMFAVIFRQ
jgi:putative membrane protein